MQFHELLSYDNTFWIQFYKATKKYWMFQQDIRAKHKQVRRTTQLVFVYLQTRGVCLPTNTVLYFNGKIESNDASIILNELSIQICVNFDNTKISMEWHGILFNFEVINLDDTNCSLEFHETLLDARCRLFDLWAKSYFENDLQWITLYSVTNH